MRLLLASVVLTLFFSLPARAESWCRALTWPVSRDSSLSEMKEDLAKIDRFELVQLAWGELTTEQKKPMFAPILMPSSFPPTDSGRDRDYFRRALRI